MNRTEILIHFLLTVFEIIYCVGQVSEGKDDEVLMRDSGDSSRFSRNSGEFADVESAAITHNPCFVEESRAEDKNAGPLDVDPNWTSQAPKKNHTLTELLLPSNATSFLRFSEHFLNCNRIGIERDSTEFLPNGTIYVPQLSRIFDPSEFCQDGTGLVFVCEAFRSSEEKNTTSYEASAFAHLSDEFLNCSGHIEIEKESFEYRPNRSVYVPDYNRVFNYANHLIGQDGQLYICPVFFPNEEKFPEAFEIVTVVGLSVSILFIILYMIFFAFMESLRNLPGYCLFSLCLALLTAYFCFLLRSMGPEQCGNLVLSIMYFFLAAFFWMNVLSFDVWRSLKMATSKLRLSGNNMQWKRFALYSLYAWLSPLCIVIFGILVTKYQTSIQFLHLEFHPSLCWFAKKGALFVYLALPLVILMCLNVIFFTTSFIMITRASMNTSENMATFWKRFFLFLRLAVIMGVAWIFGIIAAATNQPVLFYIFVILNTLQGVFIFFSFALSEKAKQALKNKVKMRKSSVFPSQVTSQPAQSVTTI